MPVYISEGVRAFLATAFAVCLPRSKPVYLLEASSALLSPSIVKPTSVLGEGGVTTTRVSLIQVRRTTVL